MVSTNLRVEHLTASEKKKLKGILIGYGNLKAAAEKTNLHRHTLRMINISGKAEPETLKIIRERLFLAESATTQ